jgi:hypothetical protein
MNPLDDSQRRDHVQYAVALKFLEIAWDALVREDLEDGLDQAERLVDHLRVMIKNKVVPIRGPKGRGI